MMQTFDDKSKMRTSLSDPAPRRGPDPGTPDREEQLICGYVSEIDPSNRITATAIVDIKGILTLPKAGAIFFEDNPLGQRLLTLALNNADLIGIKFVTLKGYPGAIYSAAFDLAVWDLQTVSYDELTAELVSNDRIAKMKKDEAGERQKPAPREPLLTRDRTRHYDDFLEVETPDENTDLT